jgi:hypothetical protein
LRPLAAAEIVPLERYAELRTEYRERVIAHKRRRRVPLGENATLLFEDRETLRFQVQEMLWVERIAEPDKVQLELDVYNELMPGASELSATLFLEIPEAAEIRPTLERLLGIDRHLALVLGEKRDEREVRARFDERQLEEARISAVQYVRFPLGAAERARFVDPAVRARLRSDHPRYAREQDVPAEVRASLVASLETEPEPLLTASSAPAPAAEPELLFATARVRARRAPGSSGLAHVIVEPLVPVASLLDADPELEAALLAAVKRVAGAIAARHGRCRIASELGPDAGPLRWHLYGSAPES